jgi:hypothetical protein
MYDKIPVNQCATFRNPTEGLWDNTPLSNAFFSGKNICYIQNAIRNGVYQKSKGHFTISNQDEDTLKIIMRSIFLQHAANQPNNIKQQIQQLNKIVLDYAVPATYNEAVGYQKYREDQSTLVVPLELPLNHDRNYKQLQLKPWF